MDTRILDGYQLALEQREKLVPRVAVLKEKGVFPVVAAVLFREDAGSQLYTRLKSEMAASLGIEYRVSSFSLVDSLAEIQNHIRQLNTDPTVTGIIIQKPWRKTWIEAHVAVGFDGPLSEAGEQTETEQEGKAAFQHWWETLITTLEVAKDVDGLHPSTLQAISQGEWQKTGRVLPATCQATLSLLAQAFQTSDQADELFTVLRERGLKTVILGKSDLLGQPLCAVLSAKKCIVEMIGSQELKTRIENKIFLKDADIVVSATGRKNLITGELLKEGVVVIDVGEPQGDVDAASVRGVAAVLSPVPGGVGPMTVVSLMENAVAIGENSLLAQ